MSTIASLSNGAFLIPKSALPQSFVSAFSSRKAFSISPYLNQLFSISIVANKSYQLLICIYFVYYHASYN